VFDGHEVTRGFVLEAVRFAWRVKRAKTGPRAWPRLTLVRWSAGLPA